MSQLILASVIVGKVHLLTLIGTRFHEKRTYAGEAGNVVLTNMIVTELCDQADQQSQHAAESVQGVNPIRTETHE